ncbi:hypothetical protein [Sphingobacterium cavernae]|uniref:hypothetical protein n=1 Tax=Sphingobacterium cavernae TaxID=2592657 RepID=UPI0012302134|nr:hypothetical protein [Sphingobacterium cavernae]
MARSVLVYIKFTFLFCTLLFSTSCAEFVEYPLDNDKIEILAPTENYITHDSIVSFWWTTHEDAKYYRVQVVKPNFSATDKILVDSVVWDDKLVISLDTGTYSWRVRPENDGSVGNFVERKLRILDKP